MIMGIIYHFKKLIRRLRASFFYMYMIKKFRVMNNGDVLDNTTGEKITQSDNVIPDNGVVDLFTKYKDVTNLRFIAKELDMSVKEVKELLKR